LKTLALLAVLVLHVSGLWTHLPARSQAKLSSDAAATSTGPIAALSSPLEPGVDLPVKDGSAPLNLAAGSAIAVDAETGTILYSQDANAPRPIASDTKLITTMVVLSRHHITDTVTIPAMPTYQPADEVIGLVPGETYTVGALVQAALIQSADDAADALALYDAGTSQKFSAEMNAKMKQWGITGTHFSSPSGLQDTNNFATASALEKIAALALTDPFIKQTVDQPAATITSGTGRTINLTTTDDLLASGSFYGIKTGYTPAAGECFVGLTRIQGHEVITVVLGATDRFGATQDLANWIGNNWQWL
jgi:D-alanyl-D-alanine carboxypeptidase (penicillin-binding protein 5/6)